jgi:hypothetical protein
MSDGDFFNQPATDVPIERSLGSFINTIMWWNRSAVAGAFILIELPSGGRKWLYAGEAWGLDAEDTSREFATGKAWGAVYTTTGDNQNIQRIEWYATYKSPIGLGAPIHV